MVVRFQLPNVHGLLCFDWANLAWWAAVFQSRLDEQWAHLSCLDFAGGKFLKMSTMACVSDSDVSLVIGRIPAFKATECFGIIM